MILRVAIPYPLFSLFDYLPTPDFDNYQIGMRVQVSFGRQKAQIGIIVELADESEFANKLKPIIACLDQHPILSHQQIKLTQWVSDYYHLPIGETFQLLLPKKLREGAHFYSQTCYYQQTDLAQALISNNEIKSKIKLSILNSLEHPQTDEAICAHFPTWKTHRRSLLQDNLISANNIDDETLLSQSTQNTAFLAHDFSQNMSYQLNEEQIIAVDAIKSAINHYRPFLLNGVTGSGKTAVYIEAIRHYLALNKQVIVLVPEIGLTPQLLNRFTEALGFTPEIIHSNISDNQRFRSYRKGLLQQAKLIIGTRSALFANLPNLGLIILDEEHDASFRQNEGLRYSARDCAIMRAFIENIPIVLGSATPSLESLNNALSNKYQHLQLTNRAIGALPEVFVIDNRREIMINGISKRLLDTIQQVLNKNEQVMIFLNRRGYAPVLYCDNCQFIVDCPNCDAHLIYHVVDQKLHCHHCAYKTAIPKKCPSCEQPKLISLGSGTQRVEETLKDYFPQFSTIRIDRDSTSKKEAFNTFLEEINAQQHQIILGTQMLAKGHDFANVTLAALLNVDNLLFSDDFRAEENLAQILTQFAGRSGRAEKKGKVLIQTNFPDHRIFHQLFKNGYQNYAEQLLKERKSSQLPPYIFQALIKGEDKSLDNLLKTFNKLLESLSPQWQQLKVESTPAIPANLSKKQGIHRAFILIQSSNRRNLHQALTLWQQQVLSSKMSLRYFLDIDPIDFH